MTKSTSRVRILGCLLGLGALGAALVPGDAQACGGCFAPVDPPTLVSGHRMVMSISPTQSVLWDQIQYSGEPEEFAWVLPVKPGARVEASTAAFFEVLEGQTATRIIPPPLDCGGGSNGGLGCGAALSAASEGGDGDFQNGEPAVDVLHEGTVGPYETVTLSTEIPGALNDWLEDHGYNVDDASQPIIDQYVAEGFDFIALRLQPGKGVSQMTPVRVVMEGGGLTLPLRMVGIGTGPETPIVLYVVSEGRYTTQNFPEAALNTGLLSWNFKTQESNYTALRESAFAAHPGGSFLTTFAAQGFFTTGYFDQFDFSEQTFGDLYLQQALDNGEIATACSVPPTTSGQVENPCPPGEPWDSPACGTVAPGNVDARTLGCAGAEDLAVAFNGLRIEDVWLTRLEAVLPREALADDLVLQAAAQQTPVFRDVQASIALEPDGACPSGIIPRVIDLKKPPQSPFAVFAGLGLGLAGALLTLRRLRLRRAS